MKQLERCPFAALLVLAISTLPVLAPGQPSNVKTLPKPFGKSATHINPADVTNQDVIEMVGDGLSGQLVTASIRQTARHAFDSSPQGLTAHKKSSGCEAVIVVMLATSAPPAVPPQERLTPARLGATGAPLSASLTAETAFTKLTAIRAGRNRIAGDVDGHGPSTDDRPGALETIRTDLESRLTRH